MRFSHIDCSRGTCSSRRGMSNARRTILTILIAAFHLIPLAVRAQTQNVDAMDLSPEELKTVHVYTASMYLQSDREAPSSVTIVTADQIRKFGYRTLAEILNSVRGFYVNYDRNYNYVGVLGFSQPGDYNDHVLLLIDGHRMNDNVYGQALIGTGFPLDIDLIDRVEVVRGPSSSLYGASAFLAVINVITKLSDRIGGVQMSADAGSFGSYKGRATYGGSTHGVNLLLSGTIYESSGASSLYFPAYNSPATNNGIAENADGDSSKNLFATVKFGHFTLQSLISTRDKTIPTASFGTIFNDPRTNTVDAAGYLDLQYTRTLQQDTSLTVRFAFDDDAYHGVYVEPGAVPQASPVLNEDLDHGEWLTFNANLTRTFWKKHKVTVGMELEDDLKQDQTNYNLSPYFLFLQDRRTSIEGAVFVQDEFRITKNLILNAGVRHDQYKTFGGTTNPRLALLFSPVKSATIKLIYGQAFRAPNNYELYFTDGFSVGANPGLRPEKIKDTELIWEQNLRNNFRLSASLFDDRIANLIGQQTNTQNGFLIYENSGSVASRGFEIELAGKMRWDIEGRVSYTLQRTVDGVTQLSLTNSPPQLAKMNLTAPLVHHWFSMGVEGLYADPRKTYAGTYAGRYAIANVTVSSREFGGGFQLSASVYNLFNNKYSDPVGPEIEEPALQQNGRGFRIQISRAIHFY